MWELSIDTAFFVPEQESWRGISGIHTPALHPVPHPGKWVIKARCMNHIMYAAITDNSTDVVTEEWLLRYYFNYLLNMKTKTNVLLSKVWQLYSHSISLTPQLVELTVLRTNILKVGKHFMQIALVKPGQWRIQRIFSHKQHNQCLLCKGHVTSVNQST